MYRKLILCASVLALLATQAGAAVLQLQGIASVDHGGGFAPAVNNMNLNPGDRIRADSGCANVVYDNGYRSKVCGGQMALVMYNPPQPLMAGSLKDPPVYVAPVAQNDLLTPGLVVLGGAGIGIAIALSTTGAVSP